MLVKDAMISHRIYHNLLQSSRPLFLNGTPVPQTRHIPNLLHFTSTLVCQPQLMSQHLKSLIAANLDSFWLLSLLHSWCVSYSHYFLGLDFLVSSLILRIPTHPLRPNSIVTLTLNSFLCSSQNESDFLVLSWNLICPVTCHVSCCDQSLHWFLSQVGATISTCREGR